MGPCSMNRKTAAERGGRFLSQRCPERDEGSKGGPVERAFSFLFRASALPICFAIGKIACGHHE